MDSDGYPSPRKGKIRLARVQWLVNVKESLVVPYVVISSNGKYKYYDIKGRREFTVKASKSASDERLIESDADLLTIDNLCLKSDGRSNHSSQILNLSIIFLSEHLNIVLVVSVSISIQLFSNFILISSSSIDFINSIIDDSYAYEDVRKIALAIQRSMKATRGMYLDYIKTMAQKSNNLLEWE